MPTTLTISKNPVYPTSMDWLALRREGIRHIERLGSAIWTDYNLHDPGITILEVLCYAITDLGYRVNLPMNELTAVLPGRKPFYTAAEILTNHPVTALDIRKILIDLPGVRNAWLEPTCEDAVRFYLDLGTLDIINIQPINPYLKLVFGEEQPIATQIGIRESKDANGNINVNVTKINYKDIWRNVNNEFIQEILADIQQYKCGGGDFDTPAKRRKALADARKALYDALFNNIFNQIANKDGGADSVKWIEEDGEKIKKALLLYLTDDYHEDIRAFIHSLIGETLPVEYGEHQFANNMVELDRVLEKYRKVLKDANNDVNAEIVKAAKKKLDDHLNLFFPTEVTVANQSFNNIRDGVITYVLLCFLLEQSIRMEEISDPKPVDYYTLFQPKGIYTILLELEEGTIANEIKAAGLERLHGYRNLCEDFNSDIKIVEKIPLSVCANMEIKPDADPELVLAKVYDAIESYLSPPVYFYTLQEMLDKYGVFRLSEVSFENLADASIPTAVLEALRPIIDKLYTSKTTFLQTIKALLNPADYEDYQELIFLHAEKKYDSHPVYQGPLLEHGFIDEAELEEAKPRFTVYKSDLYQVILQVPEVIQIQNLYIDKCKHGDGKRGIQQDNWCLSFDCYCLPELDIYCSEFRFTTTTGSGYTSPETYLAKDRLEMLQAQRLKVNRKGTLDIPVPQGTYRADLADFTSIQEDFPATYHVGRDGIAKTEPPLRKAQVKQLKGYLLFFDQILANYLAHLAQVRDTLALDRLDALDTSKNYQPLYEVPGIKELLLDFIADDQSWEDFKADKQNAYMEAIRLLMEGNAVEVNLRRNRLLDHLLARFGETFTDYTTNLYQIERPVNRQTAQAGGMVDLIDDKKRFLQRLPECDASDEMYPLKGIGSRRARAFNYRATPLPYEAHIWNSENVAGLKRRVCALLGMEDATRHRITCQPDFVEGIKTINDPQTRTRTYKFGIKTSESERTFLLLSTAQFRSINAAQTARQRFMNQSLNINKYGIVDNRVGFWENADVGDRTLRNALLLSPKEMNLNPEGAQELKDLIIKLAKPNCQDDSFHLVEHILLRPRDEYYDPLLKTMICCPDDLTRLDPYSFWITVVVPDWVERFADATQFHQFEQVLRSETSAHIAVHICKYNPEEMLEFETAYYEWLVQIMNPEIVEADLRDTTNKLVMVLNKYSKDCTQNNSPQLDAPTCLPA